jgi:hypothetical protein
VHLDITTRLGSHGVHIHDIYIENGDDSVVMTLVRSYSHTLYAIHCTLPIHYLLYTTHYTLYTAHYTLYTAHYKLYSAHYTLYTAHYTLYTTHCTL